jgi:uncharacterized protein YrzB (UPF0473 family)
MEEMERDVVMFADEEGNELEFEVIDYFDYEEQEYGLLADTREGHEADFYIMKIVADGEYEEFVAPDPDKMEALTAIVQERVGGCGGNCAGCDSGCAQE